MFLTPEAGRESDIEKCRAEEEMNPLRPLIFGGGSGGDNKSLSGSHAHGRGGGTGEKTEPEVAAS